MKNQITKTPTEGEEQATLFHWCEMVKGKYPELQLLFHIPNGGERRKSEAARMKAEGVKAGVPDLFLPVARVTYHGLFIEMKRRKGGRVSDEQREWIGNLLANGYAVEVCRGWEEAKDAIENYLDEKYVPF
jgi:hypothetical protein